MILIKLIFSYLQGNLNGMENNLDPWAKEFPQNALAWREIHQHFTCEGVVPENKKSFDNQSDSSNKYQGQNANYYHWQLFCS